MATKVKEPTASDPMKTYMSYQQQMEQQVRNTANQIGQNRLDAANQYIDTMQKAYDQSIDYMTNSTDQQIAGLDQQYQSVYDTNAINRLINQRQAADTMARMGLSQSGLNATQQLGLMNQQYNADAAATQQKTGAVNTLKAQLEQYKANIQQQRLQNEAQTLYDAHSKNADTYENTWNNLQNLAASFANTKFGAELEERLAAIQQNYQLTRDQEEYQRELAAIEKEYRERLKYQQGLYDYTN